MSGQTVKELAIRMQLAAIRQDDQEWLAAYGDFQAIREAEFAAGGASTILSSLMWMLANMAAGATVDVDGGNAAASERFLEEWIQRIRAGAE
jgi:hypothetical protein